VLSGKIFLPKSKLEPYKIAPRFYVTSACGGIKKNGISYTIKLVHFAHNWNDGIMGTGKMEHCFVGKIPLDKEINKRVSSPKNQLR